MDVVESLTVQAHACTRLGSPMYGELLDALADDYTAGGPTSVVLQGHEADPGPSALGLRLLGSVHRLVLSGRAPEFAMYYPSVGGTFIPAAAADALVRFLGTDADAVRQWLDQSPQTNEIGRSAALYGGLLHLPWDLPVRLFELGSSGGLNLRADRFAYVTRDTVLGDVHSSVRLEIAWAYGPEARPVEIVHRMGCDIAPVDVLSEEGQLTLTSYVWPDQPARLERLRSALALAAEVPAEVTSQGTPEFVEGIELSDGAVTVLWHSFMFQYLSPEDQEAVTSRIEALGAAATDDQPFAHLSFEPTRRTAEGEHEFLVVLQAWPGGETRVLGKAHPHGLPVHWEAHPEP